MKLATLESARAVLIYGYGLEGKSSERFLAERYPRIRIDIFDNNISEFNAARTLANYDAVIVSPSVPRDLLRGVSAAKITSQAEIFFDNISDKQRRHVIGITGSKGKSTTTTFCVQMLKRAGVASDLGGNIGKTFLELLDRVIDNSCDFVIAELSSFQLEHLRVSPGIAGLLNIFPEHLDHHQSFDRYVEAKRNLWKHQARDDIVIATEGSKRLLETHHGLIHCAGPMPEGWFANGSMYRARHFRQNLGVIARLAQLLGIADEVVQDTAWNFEGLPHRLELFATLNGIQFCNDSAATNLYATLAAVEALGDKIGSIILGGVNPGVSYQPLIDGILKHSPQAMIIIMDTEVAAAIISAIDGQSLRYGVAADLSAVVQQAFEKTPENTVCLLSPAAKSFGWFQSYSDRGERFKREVLRAGPRSGAP